jgi:hypothetical protein
MLVRIHLIRVAKEPPTILRVYSHPLKELPTSPWECEDINCCKKVELNYL